MAASDQLDGPARELVLAARRATLATIAPDGHARLVPVCFALLGGEAWIPIDEKPKAAADPLDLARVRDIVARPAVTLLVDRWDEDWSRLAWVRMEGRAAMVGAGETPDARSAAIAGLRARYPQYETHALEERPLIRIAIERVVAWGSLA